VKEFGQMSHVDLDNEPLWLPGWDLTVTIDGQDFAVRPMTLG
jgi:regulatory protein YycI of two-component signal transduction system YycFG